jgi:chemotaxis response regulator CheB
VTTTPIWTFCADQRAGPRGVRALGADQTTEVVGEASPSDEGLEKVADLTPTVVVMNVHTPRLDFAGAS